MKQCAKCLEEKSENEFYKRKSAKKGLYAMCKKCRQDYRRKFYSDNVAINPSKTY